jgi:hypothetical protein
MTWTKAPIPHQPRISRESVAAKFGVGSDTNAPTENDMKTHPVYYNTPENRIALRSAGLYVQEPFLDIYNTGIDQTQPGWFSGYFHEKNFPWTGVIYRERENGAIGPQCN